MLSEYFWQGPAGVDGEDGVNGSKGERGEAGPAGKHGRNGKDGTNVSYWQKYTVLFLLFCIHYKYKCSLIVKLTQFKP